MVCKVGLFESAFVVFMPLSVLLAVCHRQAPPPQEPMAEDQKEAVGPGPQVAPPQPNPLWALTKEPPTAGAKAATQADPMSHHAHSLPLSPPATVEQAQSVSQYPRIVSVTAVWLMVVF